MFDYMDGPITTTIVIILLAVVALGFLLADVFITEPITITGEVIDLQYTPSSTHVGVGTSNNNPVVVTSSESEKWIVILKLKNNKIQSYKISSDKYYSVHVGDTAEFSCRKGKVFGFVSCEN